MDKNLKRNNILESEIISRTSHSTEGSQDPFYNVAMKSNNELYQMQMIAAVIKL